MTTTTGVRMAWWKRDGRRATLTDEALADIGERIRKARLEKGWRTVEFARKVDRDSSGISDVERGKSAISLGALLQFADALEVPLAALLPGGFGDLDGEQYSLGFRHGYLHAIDVAQKEIPPLR
jgi:transcriptional regulator with XRE-family HTH domain